MTIVGGIYGFGQYVDYRIKSAVNGEQFIKKVASHVRPYVIFDANETIYVDGGAMQYLENIEVEQVVIEDGYTIRLKIIITPKSHLAYSPILETLTPIKFYVTPKRGSRHQWVYELKTEGIFVLRDESRQKEPPRFRLEILR